MRPALRFIGEEMNGDGGAQERFREEETDGGVTNMADIREIRGEG